MPRQRAHLACAHRALHHRRGLRLQADGLQALARVSHIGGQAQVGPGQLGLFVRSVGRGAQVHRRQGGEAVVRQLVDTLQIAPQRATAYGQHDVVHGRTRHQAAQCLELAQQEAS